MRRYRKKELNRIFDNMNSLSLMSESCIKAELFENLQNLAIQAGNLIEESEGCDSEFVHSLEEYCEIIYRMSLCKDSNSYSLLHKEQEQVLNRLIKNVETQIPTDKLIAAFLPYKASMWDSLESVWMAAEKDPECDAYVIPVPYYDKNEDGTLGTMHYEGSEYPDYVNVTNWDNINLSEMHPDIIYFHNPYDNGNKLTSVHPDYYASRLKKYTDRLVYIPYFVCVDNVKTDFCITPGVLHANYVIVESKEVQQLYIDTINKFEREIGSIGVFGNLKEKILAIGSPKYDRLSNYEYEVPEEWNGKIFKDDGTRKKIILYNTSISRLMVYKEQAILKIKDVIEIMKNEKDLVFLWRPHPLYMETVKSISEELYKEFVEIVASFKNVDNFIYDDTSDMNRAIAISDAYYGDRRSSMQALYERTGKPIMLQEEAILYRRKSI